MGTARQDIYEELKNNLYKDDAVIGEAAGIAIGLVMLGTNSVQTLQEFKAEVGLIRGLEGDNEFSSAAVKKFCDDNDIRLDTSVAKEEHISNGNKLGIIDRLVRTPRELIER